MEPPGRDLDPDLPLGEPPVSDAIEERRVMAEAEAALFGDAAFARIGRFTIQRRLGAGGFGTVYAAHDPTLDRAVAVKVMRARPPSADSGEQERMHREARAMARLSHPNVVTVHEVGVAEGRVFVAMELVRGKTLREWLESEQPAWTEILPVFIQAAHGLSAAHQAGLVHRDFKPENLLVGDDGRVRVTDFGLATDGDTSADFVSAAGTPAYMAPEQHARMPSTPAADQFAFCVALFEALFGCRPFSGKNAAELAALKALGEIEPPPPNTDVPRRIAAVLHRGLALRPEDRWPSLETLITHLERDPPNNPVRLILIAIVTLILTAALLGAIMQGILLWDWLHPTLPIPTNADFAGPSRPSRFPS